ncbi:MAG: NusG domain II-containing protein [Clostridia bacterium]|nr:NusG domain II-containing protein [Clostridia bacterium]
MKIGLIKKADIFIIAGVVLICVLGIILLRSGDSGKLTAVITVDGEVYESVDLSKVDSPYEITTPTVPRTVIAVEKNAVYFRSSECENQLCVKSGILDRGGETAVCLPAKVVVTVRAQRNVDAVTY